MLLSGIGTGNVSLDLRFQMDAFCDTHLLKVTVATPLAEPGWAGTDWLASS
jgi:hypothetical protein